MFQIADMHCDTISALYNFGKPEDSLRRNNFHLDLERLKDSNYILQTFALYQDISKEKSPYKYARNLLNLYNKELEKNFDIVTPILYKEDIDQLKENQKIGSLLTLEEGEACEGSLDKLLDFFNEGVRLITLTWNNQNSLGFPNKFDLSTKTFIPDIENGLTAFGIDFIQEMENLGIILDVSHLSDKGFYDVYQNSKKPFIASHSNARALSNIPRNLTDDMIKKISERGGIIGLNFCGDFIDSNTGFASIQGLVDHLKYLVNKGGIDVVGLGTDFDGIPNMVEIDNCSKMPFLLDSLKKEGFSEDEIEKIANKNVLRVFREILPSKL